MLSNESVLYILLSAFHTQLWAFKARESLSGSHKMPIKRNGQKLSAKSLILGKRGRQRELHIFALFTEMSSASQHMRESSTRRFSKSLSPALSLQFKTTYQKKFSCTIPVQNKTKLKRKERKKLEKKMLARKFHCLIYTLK